MTISFMTLNIWNGGMLFDALVSYLKKEKPDILFLQEVYNGENPKLEKRFRAFRILKEELGYPYQEFAAAFLDTRIEGKIDRGSAIFTKFPITDAKNIFYDIPYSELDLDHATDYQFIPMSLFHIALLLDGQELHAFNTHGIWGWDGMDNKRRIAMSETIVSEVKGKAYVILAGDFNMHPDTQAISNIEKHLTSVFKNRLKTTFNMQVKKGAGFGETAVDMVFVSKNIQVLQASCPQVDISDHLPLVCRLEL